MMSLNQKKLIVFNLILTIAIIIYLLLQSFKPEIVSSYTTAIKDGKDIEKYLIDNPQSIISSLEKHHKNQLEAQNKKAKDVIVSQSKTIFNNLKDPRVGNPDAKIKVVEFFDYYCGYCQKMLAIKRQILENNKDIEIIFKELPIMGENSVIKSKVSLAFYQIAPKKYAQFQEELFKVKDNIADPQTYVNIAKSLGEDETAFKKAFEDILKQDNYLKDNIKLAMDLGLQGTPAYIIGGEIIPGYTTYEVINSKIAAQRKGN